MFAESQAQAAPLVTVLDPQDWVQAEPARFKNHEFVLSHLQVVEEAETRWDAELQTHWPFEFT